MIEMRKKEAKWQTLWGKYIQEKRKEGFYCYYELKQTEKKSFLFNNIEPHQYLGLQATEKEGMAWKFSDQDQRQKPCDGFSGPPLPSYLVIKFSPGYYMIRIAEIVKMTDDGKIGITIEHAEKIAERIVVLK